MTLKIEKIYQSSGDELNTSFLTADLSNAYTLVYDESGYVWVTCGTDGIAIYKYYGPYCDDEPSFTDLSDLNYGRYDSGDSKKLRLTTFIKITANLSSRVTRDSALALSSPVVYTSAEGFDVYANATSITSSALDAKYIVKAGTSMFVTSGTTFKKIQEFDIATQAFVREIDVKETFDSVDYGMNSNLASDGTKLWFVGTYFSDTVDKKFYVYTPSSSSKSTNTLYSRPSTARTWICFGYNGSMYFTDYNNVSVTKYNASDATYQTQIRTNAFPTRIYSASDKRIWVNSYAGMITLIDWDDDQAHNSYGSEESTISLAVDPLDGTKIWFTRIDGKLVRYDLNDLSQIETVVTIEPPIEWTTLGDITVRSDGFTPLDKPGATTQWIQLGGTDDEFTSEGDSGTIGGASGSFSPDGTINVDAKIAIDTGLSDLSSASTFVTEGEKDWFIKEDLLTNPGEFIITPEHTYTSGGTITVKPYMFVINDDKLLAFNLYSVIKREAYGEINGQSAVVGGAKLYFGEQG